MSQASILVEIQAERRRQDRLHPDSANLPDGTGADGYRIYAELAREVCTQAAASGKATFADVLLEETFEALAETDPAKLRAELVQVAAVAVRWIEKLSREAE